MAATYGRLTGKTGVCLATLGPGATNFVTGAAYAQLGGMPLLMITGQKPIKKSKQGQFQIIDAVSMMEPLTKYTRQIVNVDMIPSMVREAFRLAQEERPGAVHLELPEDVAEEPVDEHTTPVFNISTCRRGDANERAIDDAIKMIKEATRPLLLLGAGLPSAMEAARFYPNRRVMAICGDGGFMMNSQELETAVRLNLNLVVLILKDNSYGMIRWKQYGMGLPDFGLEFGNPDFVMYANSYGAHGHRVKSTEMTVPLLEKCYTKGGVHLVEIPVDYSENQKVLVDELQAKTCLL